MFAILLANTPAVAQSLAATQLNQTACVSCHGETGNSAVANIPSLAGQPRIFLETQLVMIREGLREIPEMNGLLKQVSDQQIQELSTLLASQALETSNKAVKDVGKFARGEELSKKSLCGTCHMPQYQGQNQVPRLAGQREDYLLKTMIAMRDGKAVGRDTMMSGVLAGFSDQQISAMAHFFSIAR